MTTAFSECVIGLWHRIASRHATITISSYLFFYSSYHFYRVISCQKMTPIFMMIFFFFFLFPFFVFSLFLKVYHGGSF